MLLKGRKALVFGGTSGIGLATCQSLLARGVQVVAISRNPREGLPADLQTAQCDVRDREQMAALFAEQAPFDILVSAATGGDRAVGPFLQMDLDGFQGSFDKLWGYANVVRLGAEHLTADGTIVLVSGAPARKCKPGQVIAAFTATRVYHLTSCCRLHSHVSAALWRISCVPWLPNWPRPVVESMQFRQA